MYPAPSSAEFAAAHARIVYDFGTGRIATEEYCALVTEASRGGCTPEVVARVLHGWSQQEYPGVGAVFDHLDRTSVQTAVLSNTNPEHWQRLADRNAPNPEYPTVLRLQHLFASHLAPADLHRCVPRDRGHRDLRGVARAGRGMHGSRPPAVSDLLRG